MTRLGSVALIVAWAALSVSAPAQDRQGEGALIEIPSLTAPVGAPEPTEADPDPDSGGGTGPTLYDPADPGTGRLDRARRAAPSARDEGEAPVAPLLSLRAGVNPGTTLRMQGEHPEAHFSIFLPHDAVPGALRLRHFTGVDVLPERSVMEVTLNGTPVGQHPLTTYGEDAETEIAVPAGIWQSGRNEVTVRLDQVHRLFCGPEAAFDLWTDIDLTTSGAVLNSRTFRPGAIDFLAGVAHDAGVGRSIGIRDPAGHGKAAEPILDELAMRLTALLRGRILTYRDSPAYGATGGENGEPPARARITILPDYGTAPRATFRRGGDGAIVLALSMPLVDLDRADAVDFIDTLLVDLAAEGISIDAEAVQTGIDPRTRMGAGEPVTLTALGLGTVRTSSHYFRRDQIFTLPRDWLTLTAQKAILHLDYGYARGLHEDSTLLIRVNGETVRLLPLRGEGGELIEKFPIKFSANLLNEGPNLLQFEALIPGQPEDAACPVEGFPKLEIRGTSTLRVPPSPRLRFEGVRLPVYALRGRDITKDGVPLSKLPVPERLTLVATLGEAIPQASRMTVLSYDRLDALPLGPYKFSLGEVGQALTREPEPVSSTIPVLPAATDRVGELPDAFLMPGAADLDPSRGGSPGLFALSLSLDDLRRRIEDLAARIIPDRNAAAETWLRDQSGRALIAQLDRDDPRALWLVLAPDTDLSEVVASLAQSRSSIGGPYGQMAMLGHDGVWRSWADPYRFPRLQEPLSYRNFRQVMGNYASWSPVAFTAILFTLALIGAGIALRLVVMTRKE